MVGCIGSIRRACETTPAAIRCWTVVVSDHSSDRTAELARGALGSSGEVIECDVRSAGAARRELSSTSATSAWLRAGRVAEPEKITSSMPEPRMFL